MNQKYSDLQLKYPLSPRKFWKKLLEKMLGLYILASVVIIALVVTIFVVSDAHQSGSISPSVVILIIIALIILFMAIITALMSWYIKVYIREYYYDAGKDFITIKKGVFAPTEIHVQWQKIQDVYVDQDLFDRFMGLYDVHIASATASSGIEAHIDGVNQASAEALKELFLARVANKEWVKPQTNSPQDAMSNENASDSQIQNKSVIFSEEISSQKYPIMGKWVVLSLWSRIISSLIIWAIIIAGFSIKIISKVGTESQISSNIVLIYIGISIISIIVSIIGLFIWKKNYSFRFNSENIYYKTGILSISEKHMPYTSIQDVTISQSFLERLFGLAKVNIENATQIGYMPQSGGSNFYGSTRTSPQAYNGIQIVGISLVDAQHITETMKSQVLGKGTEGHGL